MNAKIRRQIARSKQRIQKRLNKHDCSGAERPQMSASNIHYEIADRTRAVSVGGIGLVHQMVKRLELDQAIDRSLPLFKVHLPYHESDHVLNVTIQPIGAGLGSGGSFPVRLYSPRAARMASSGCWRRSFSVRNTDISTLCVNAPRSL